MKWKNPHILKIYEALGTIADGRLEVDGNSAKCFSSSGNKFYTITYDPNTNSIMCNDNASYWKGSLGYPAIAFLMKIGVLDFNQEYANALKGIMWKDINQKFKNDFSKAREYIDSMIIEKGLNIDEFHSYVNGIMQKVEQNPLNLLGKKTLPPKGY